MRAAAEIGDLLARSGLDDVTAVEPLSAGLGGNDLWRLRRDAGDLVLRAFPPGKPCALAEREQQAHRFAAEHGLSVPAVHSCQLIGDRPVLIMDWVPGTRLADRLWSGAEPDDLGRRSGATLAGLHAVSDPPPELVAARSWLDWPQPDAEVTAALQGYDTSQVLLHLDYHPENLIVTDDGMITVLDWANCVLGPPQADLARTLSILELITAAVPELPQTARQAIRRYREGFLAGYQEAGGDVTVPDPVQGWAYAAQHRDLAGSWVPSWYLDRLQDRGRELISSARASAPGRHIR